MIQSDDDKTTKEGRQAGVCGGGGGRLSETAGEPKPVPLQGASDGGGEGGGGRHVITRRRQLNSGRSSKFQSSQRGVGSHRRRNHLPQRFGSGEKGGGPFERNPVVCHKRLMAWL